MDTVNNILNNSKYLEIATSDNTEGSCEKLAAAIGKDDILDGLCTKCSAEGNLTIEFGDTKCIMERNEVTPILQKDGLVHKATCQNKVGKTLKFRVLRFEDGVFYVSRKSVIEEVRKEYNKHLKLGQIVTGVITNIDEKVGCFVDIGGDYIAMIPKRLLEYVFVNNITDHVSVGDVIQAAVEEIDKENNEISSITLNRIAALPPYEELAKEFEPGDIVIGTVNQITTKSIFAQLTKHLNIMCKLSPKVRVQEKQKVRIKIKRIGTQEDKRLVGEIISVL